MRTEDYTPDAICGTLGIGAFDEPFSQGRPNKFFRLLLCPSFAPELSITLAELLPVRGQGRAAKKAVLSIAASRTQIWQMAAPGLVTVDRAEYEIDALTRQDVELKFRAALAMPTKSVVIADGMPTHAIWRGFASSILVSDNPARGSAFGQFVAEILNIAFSVSEDMRSRNAVAVAGRYVGLDLPFEEGATSKQSAQLTVIGVPDEQNELLAAIAAVASRQPLP